MSTLIHQLGLTKLVKAVKYNMWKITWTTKEDLDDVMTMLIAVGADDRIAKLKEKVARKKHTVKTEKELADKIDEKIKDKKTKPKK